MIGDAGEDVGKPGSGIDAVELASFDHCVHRCCAVAARVRTTESPVPAADRDAAHGSLGGVVGQADASIVEEAREGRPSFEAVVDGFGDRRFG